MDAIDVDVVVVFEDGGNNTHVALTNCNRSIFHVQGQKHTATQGLALVFWVFSRNVADYGWIGLKFESNLFLLWIETA